MGTFTAEARAKAKATRTAKSAQQPLVILAKALKTKPDTLRARLYYHKQKVKGATLGDMIETLQRHTRGKLPSAVLKLHAKARAPPIHDNPRPPRGKKGAPSEEVVGLIALQRAVNLTCEKIGTGEYDERDLSILGAGLRMLPRKR